MPFILKRVLGGSSIAGAGCLIVLAIVAIALAINTALVALVWNVCGLHSVFGAGTLSFWQCVGCGLVLGLFGA